MFHLSVLQVRSRNQAGVVPIAHDPRPRQGAHRAGVGHLVPHLLAAVGGLDGL